MNERIFQVYSKSKVTSRFFQKRLSIPHLKGQIIGKTKLLQKLVVAEIE
jgi:hypothetical protein